MNVKLHCVKNKILSLFIGIVLTVSSHNVWAQQSAPDFALVNTEGDTVHLSDFKGKVVLIDVWATWCSPCMHEMKKARPLKEKYASNPNLVFLNISIDQDKEKWLSVVEAKEIKGINLWSYKGEAGSIMKNYGVEFIPNYVLIDKNGYIYDGHAKWPSDPELEADLKKLLQ